MAYSIVQGNIEPVMPLQLLEDDEPFALDGDETCTLQYTTPSGDTLSKELGIVAAITGDLEAVWVDGETDEVGAYYGQIDVVRDGEEIPRTFPNNGALIIWTVYPKIGVE